MSDLTTKERRPTRWVAGAVGLTSLVAAVLLTLAYRQEFSPQILLACAITLICWGGLCRAIVGGARIVQILFWAFIGCWLGVAPIYQVRTGQLAWYDTLSNYQTRSIVYAQVVLALALLAYLAGSILAAHRRRGEVTGRPVDMGRLHGAAGAVVLLGLLILPAAAAASGGFAGLFVTRSDRAEALSAQGVDVATGGGPTLGFVSLLPAVLAITGAYLALRSLVHLHGHRPFLHWPMSSVVLTLLGVALLMIYVNPLANSRFTSVAALCCCIIAVFRPKRPLAGTIVAAVAVAGFLFVYPLTYALRNSTAGSVTFDISDWGGQDFDGFQQVINTVLYVEQQGLEYGSTLLSGLLFAVPRSIWEGKETPASITIAEFRGYYFTNLSLPFPAELYLNCGLALTVVLMAGLGYVSERIDQGWLTGNVSVMSVIAPLVATQQLGLLRGPVGSLAPVIGSVVVVVLLALWWARRTPHVLLAPDEAVTPRR
ncbi:hypothetical protein DMP17_44715 [Pseudonocardia sp. TMWB2A]|uniref:hypothetical protein n=1 Tax=Pseudonocardia sp. TMWB2A TaxID=687430 RepID=UPI00307E6849